MKLSGLMIFIALVSDKKTGNFRSVKDRGIFLTYGQEFRFDLFAIAN
jgi:hypothetical protein